MKDLILVGTRNTWVVLGAKLRYWKETADSLNFD
jgi:hypothetical protein